MSLSRRTVAALATATALAALVVAPQALPASATPHPGQARTAPATGSALIHGLVVDQFGRYVDDVTVRATKADGTAVASARTYESDWEEGPQHGYFFLWVTRGTYTVTFSRPGYKTVVEEDVVIRRARQRLDLDEIEVVKLLTPTTTSAGLVQRTVNTKQNGVVQVTVGPLALKATGKVEIREGRRVVGKATLRSRDKGKVTIGLDRLSKGAHVLKAYYLGSPEQKPSTSAAFTLTVAKAKR